MNFEPQSPSGESSTEIAHLLGAATAALARFDAEQLERLGVRALELQALRALDGVAAEEAAARLRVFASVLRATGNGLDVLRRVSGADPGFAPHTPRLQGQGWELIQPVRPQPGPGRQV